MVKRSPCSWKFLDPYVTHVMEFSVLWMYLVWYLVLSRFLSNIVFSVLSNDFLTILQK